MLRKRIIFVLIYSDEFFMQSRNFRLQKVGNLKWLEKNYKIQKVSESIDELIVLNATKSKKSINKFAKSISSLVSEVFIPIAAGGGIRTVEDAESLFNHGADKIILNTALIENVDLVLKLIEKYGSQSIVGNIDYKNINGKNIVHIKDGTKKIPMSFEKYLSHIDSLNIGEIYLNSIDRDGTGFGYDYNTISQIQSLIKTPLIIAGGAGNETHLLEGLKYNGVNAVATANLFNFIGDGLPNARKKIIKLGGNLANWDDY